MEIGNAWNIVILYISLCHVLTLPISLLWLPEVTAENEDEASLFGFKDSKAAVTWESRNTKHISYDNDMF